MNLYGLRVRRVDLEKHGFEEERRFEEKTTWKRKTIWKRTVNRFPEDSPTLRRKLGEPAYEATRTLKSAKSYPPATSATLHEVRRARL